MPQLTQDQRNEYQRDYSSREHAIEERRARKRKWYADNREAVLAYQHEYHYGNKKKKAKSRAYHRKYQAKLRAAAKAAALVAIGSEPTNI